MDYKIFFKKKSLFTRLPNEDSQERIISTADRSRHLSFQNMIFVSKNLFYLTFEVENHIVTYNDRITG